MWVTLARGSPDLRVSGRVYKFLLSLPRDREAIIFDRNPGVFFPDLGQFCRYQIRAVVFGDIDSGSPDHRHRLTLFRRELPAHPAKSRRHSAIEVFKFLERVPFEKHSSHIFFRDYRASCPPPDGTGRVEIQGTGCVSLPTPVMTRRFPH